MILLDTDHVTVLRYTEHPRCVTLEARLRTALEQPATTTIITFEEQMRCALAEIRRWRDFHRQVAAYDRLVRLAPFFNQGKMVPFDERAAVEAERLRKQRVRIGTPDLKIAAIALVHGALLLSANLRDYNKGTRPPCGKLARLTVDGPAHEETRSDEPAM
jgi:tRNA(fMet)-specific endonuclease VapC